VSRNLVELIRRHHSVHAPTALDVLKAAVDDHGELTDEDRRHAAEVSGLPEATVQHMIRFMERLRDMHRADPLAFEVCVRHVASVIEDQRLDEGRADPRDGSPPE